MSTATIQKAIGDADAYVLPSPQPLRRELPKSDPFPLHALGECLEPAARSIINSVQVPEALAAQSLLAAATLAVQGHANVVIDGRTYPISENFVSVAESGERKSATDRIALAPHKKRQQDLKRAYENQLIDYQAEHAAWKRTKDNELSDKKKSFQDIKQAMLNLGAEPEPPIDAILTTEEPTYEGLVKALANGWPSIGIFSDEGGRFLGGHGMNSENQLKTATGLSKLWDGDAITRTRGGDGNMLLLGRRVSVHLMIQPEISNTLFGNSMLIGQGLLSRCLVCFPQSNIGNRQYREHDLNQDPDVARYFARMMDILETPLPLTEDSRNQLEPREIPLSVEAKSIWVRFHDHIEALCKDDHELHPIRGFAAKAAEHAARIAGVLALTDDLHANKVSPKHIEAGIELCQFYLGEALRLFNSAVDHPDLVLAEKLIAWAKVKGHKILHLPLIYQNGPNGIRSKAAAKRIVQILEDHFHLSPIPGGAMVDGKHRREAWEVKS